MLIWFNWECFFFSPGFGLIGNVFFSTRILVFCAIVLVGSLLSFLYALSEKVLHLFLIV